MRVRAPNRDVYRVGRRWLPWRRRRRRVGGPWNIDPSSTEIDDLGGLLIAIVGSVVIAVLAPVVVLFLITGVELVLLVALLPFAVAARVLFGRHWTVEVRRGWTPIHAEPGGSWSESRKKIVGLAAEIRAGRIPTDTLSDA